MPDRISFTRPAVERIANVVRAVEGARPAGGSLGFRRQVIDNARVVKLASFVGPWAKNTENVITFKGTGRTANASNLFFPVPGTNIRECAVAKIGTAWHLIDVPFNERTAMFARGTATQTVFGTGSASTITFIPPGAARTISYISPGSTSTLNYIGSVTPESETITYLTSVSAALNTSNCTITVTPSSQSKSVVVGVKAQTATATSVSLAGTQTATIVSLDGTQTATVVSLAGTVTLTLLTSTYTSSFLTLEMQ
jgi:hypothetical protein